MIFGNDMNYAALIGPSSIFIRNFEFGRDRSKTHTENIKTASIRKIAVAGACNNLMKKTQQKLKKQLVPGELKGIQWTEAKYPLIACKEAYICAQIAVSIGCDVLVNGIKECGPDKIMKKILEIKRKNKQR